MAQTEPHGWLCSETLATRSGDFEFVNGYPTDDAAQRLRDLQLFNRATEVYLTQLMPVSEMALRQGLRSFGATKPTQVVVWEQLMDAKTVLLTANTETVDAISHLALKDDGPTVAEPRRRALRSAGRRRPNRDQIVGLTLAGGLGWLRSIRSGRIRPTTRKTSTGRAPSGPT